MIVVVEENMINRININSLNNNGRRPLKQEPRFGNGPLDFITSALQLCEVNPMVNVAVLDLSTAIIPRTIVESETNPHAGFEAFRRESSGLLIHCMIPGLVVAGIAKFLQKPIMGGKSNMSDCWANEETIDLVTKRWQYWREGFDELITKDANELFKGDKQKARVYNTIKSILEDIKGVDGKDLKSFKGMGFDESIRVLTEDVFKQIPKEKGFFAKRRAKKAAKKTIDEAYQQIVKKTRISENIKIGNSKEFFSQNLGSVVKNMPKLLKELINDQDPDKFAKAAKKLVVTKSLLGLGLVIPLAVAAQPINRWITAKTSGKKGAPIYKDFGKTKSKELTGKEKAALFRQKIISVSSIAGVALLSIMQKPNMKMIKNITQFKGIFPSMDQARLISTFAFASRMMASEDKNDLREATVRDIATFSAFYFLGDYVAKGIATLIEKVKPKIVLINEKETLKDGANILERFWHWTKNKALKSSDELMEGTPKKMRAVCQLGNIAFSLIALGLVIPKIYRHQTEKKHQEELKKMKLSQK